MFYNNACAVILSITVASSAFAQSSAPTVSAPTASTAPNPSTLAKYSTADTDLGTLLDDPAAKAILVKHLPQLVSNPQIEQGRSMTLKQLQGYAADVVTDEALKKIDDDLARIPK